MIKLCGSVVLSLCLVSMSASLVDASFQLWDVSKGESIGISEAAADFPRGGMVVVGEQHDNMRHHEAQLALIGAAHEAGLEVAVGLEMMQRKDQPFLDRFVAKEIGSTEMSRVFARNWGDFSLYRPIFEYCRQQNIRMLGLNVPREITRKVARSGFGSLTAEEIGMLPPITCEVGPDYERFLRRVSGGHGHGGSTFERFCEAQLVWDTAMAVHALAYLEDHPGSTMIVLCGMIHAWKPAIPSQVEKQSPQTPCVVIQPLVKGSWDRSTTRPEDADYLLLDR